MKLIPNSAYQPETIAKYKLTIINTTGQSDEKKDDDVKEKATLSNGATDHSAQTSFKEEREESEYSTSYIRYCIKIMNYNKHYIHESRLLMKVRVPRSFCLNA